MTIYNPLIKFHKSILGAISDNDKIKFRVKGNFNSVSFVYFKDGGDKIYAPMKKKDEYFEIELSFKKGLYFYYFDIGNGKYISNTKDFEGKISNNISTFQLTSYLNDYETPNWLKGGVIYQIFPDRFYSSGKNLDKLGKGKILHENKNDLPIYNNPLRTTPEGGNDFWESGAVRPDLILEDLIQVFHYDGSGNLNYYFRLED